MPSFYEEPRVTLHHGDCVAVMADMPADSVDASATDPPYGLEFMGKEWDRIGDIRQPGDETFTPGTGPFARAKVRHGGSPAYGAGRTSKPGIGDRKTDWPLSRGWNEWRCSACGHLGHGGSPCSCGQGLFVSADDRWVRMQAWHTQWATATFRVLKPGAHLVAFGGTRTHHRLMCAIEDAGFEIRDCLMWLYGSGFPKSKNIGAGWGTALKPAWEPIILARKPLSEPTVAANVARWGTGALNIDGCRIEGQPESTRFDPSTHSHEGWRMAASGKETAKTAAMKSGRWPANIVLDEDAAQLLDEQSGELISGKPSGIKAGGRGNAFGEYAGGIPVTGFGDSGGASRFFYIAKADRADRDGSQHPTVKPTDLMVWLIRLVTPPGGLVLDPFLGSGPTAWAAREYGYRCIGIDKEEAYLREAAHRLRQTVLPWGEEKLP